MPLYVSLLFAAALTFNLNWTPQTSHTTASLRGLRVHSPLIAWASGTAGTYLFTTDGANWHTAQVPGAESLDFRDVEAFDATTALLLASGPGQASRVYKTSDAGAHWALTLQNPDAKGFFDAFAFWNRSNGILLGDPVDGRFTIFTTSDGGSSWTRSTGPTALETEGAFAASGTCLAVHGKHDAWFGTGGVGMARVFHSADGGRSWTVSATPLASPSSSAGVFSVLFTDARRGLVVGGDYRKASESARTLALTSDGGKSWTTPQSPGLSGFRSGILRVTKPKHFLVAVGTSGSDVSTDGGRTWQSFGSGNFNAVAGVETGIWAVGPKGTIAKLAFNAR